MNIFFETNYRTLIQELVAERKRRGQELTLGRLATGAGMQKAHMTNVLKGRANFQTDQMFLICRVLELDEDETSYLLLLLEFERSAIAERRQRLAGQIEALQKKYSQSEMHLAPEKTQGENLGEVFPEYYLDPLHQLVHIAISVDRLSKSQKLLAEALGVSLERVGEILQGLERHHLIQREKDRYVNLRRNLHLKNTSPVWRPWRFQLGGLAQARIQQENGRGHFGFTTVFSADEAARRKMHGKILQLIKSFEGDVKDAPAKEVYQFSVDLMPWTGP